MIIGIEIIYLQQFLPPSELNVSDEFRNKLSADRQRIEQKIYWIVSTSIDTQLSRRAR